MIGGIVAKHSELYDEIKRPTEFRVPGNLTTKT